MEDGQEYVSLKKDFQCSQQDPLTQRNIQDILGEHLDAGQEFMTIQKIRMGSSDSEDEGN